MRVQSYHACIIPKLAVAPAEQSSGAGFWARSGNKSQRMMRSILAQRCRVFPCSPAAVSRGTNRLS